MSKVATKNYLLGYGERLNERLDPPRIRPEKADVYTFAEARTRLAPKITRASEVIKNLPAAACPHDQSVAVLTLHPSYLAKSFYPSNLLREVGLEAVGSRSRLIKPEKMSGKQSQKEQPSAELFVAGTRSQFFQWASSIQSWSIHKPGAGELIRVEEVYVPAPENRLKHTEDAGDAPMLEIVLLAPDDFVIEGFGEYMKSLDIRVNLDRRHQVEGLCFLPVRVPRDRQNEMAKFSFLRVARPMPKLRELAPGLVMRSAGMSRFQCEFPSQLPLNPELRVAVFDGGVSKEAGLDSWVKSKELPKIGSPHPDALAHGVGVTSAVLFGQIEKGKPLPQPFAAIDHYRVIDDKTHDPEGNYYDVLNRITSVLAQNKYDFVNISLGPEVAFDDNEPHLWTLELDQLFADGKSFVTVAAGNTGEGDFDSGVARIQAPSDGVNVLGVGASDRTGKRWKRASYSSRGPGRSPGLVKPDVIAFGGCAQEPFWMVDSSASGYARPDAGTSFSSPLALRAAIGIRTHLGPVVRSIALKALLIHHSECSGHTSDQVGWGRIPSEIDDLITSGDGIAHILYQGELEAGKYVRVRVPVPTMRMPGDVVITATFCYATETDPQDTVHYTRSGLDVKFRPDKTKRKPSKDGKVPLHPNTKSFFQLKTFSTEADLRKDAHQWETCMKRTRKFRGTSLNDPMFDIHYNARRGGHIYLNAKPIPYALVVTVAAKNVPNIYDLIAQRYRTQLEPLRPIIQIPIKL